EPGVVVQATEPVAGERPDDPVQVTAGRDVEVSGALSGRDRRPDTDARDVERVVARAEQHGEGAEPAVGDARGVEAGERRRAQRSGAGAEVDEVERRARSRDRERRRGVEDHERCARDGRQSLWFAPGVVTVMSPPEETLTGMIMPASRKS